MNELDTSIQDWHLRKLTLFSTCIFDASEFESGRLEIVDEFVWDGDRALMEKVMQPLFPPSAKEAFIVESAYGKEQNSNARLAFLVAIAFGWLAQVESLDGLHRVCVDHDGWVTWETSSAIFADMFTKYFRKLAAPPPS